mmetsp:Transcript_31685/g.78956  ORF Transcript_31685/g.78956 Transcript_31685/m.78956 type:complete len:87 (+) Transcript_31685:376-636(+)
MMQTGLKPPNLRQIDNFRDLRANVLDFASAKEESWGRTAFEDDEIFAFSADCHWGARVQENSVPHVSDEDSTRAAAPKILRDYGKG